MKTSFIRLAASAVLAAAVALPAMAEDAVPAKKLFGAQKLPAQMEPQSAGFYSKGCLAGGVAIPVDGPTWQVMRLSRNRNWGHPNLIKLLQRLSVDGRKAGWNGLLVGDISQPRGGPMLSGHASHQIGLDADIWLTPMPDRTLTRQEREDLSATSMLKGDSLYVDPDVWTPGHVAILRTASSYPEVERVLVHPGIKKKLCETVKGDRSWLAKVRPYWGHHYHFHMRIKCQDGSPGCKGQAPVAAGDGCGKDLAWWFTDEPWKKPKKDPNKKPVKPKVVTLKDLPPVCAQILNAEAPASAEEATMKLQ